MKNITNKCFALILTLALAGGTMPGFTLTAMAANGVPYINASGTQQTANGVTEITDATYTLSDGWYIVTGTVEVNQRITVSAAGGGAHLILADDCSFTVNGGLEVSSNNKLTIYRQTNGTGSLTAQNAAGSGAGIGGSNGSTGGTITVNGGIVTATGSGGGAGIGGGNNGQTGGTITVNGGTLTATGNGGGAGIGSGSNSQTGGTITVNGGTVVASGSGGGAGIGGGNNGQTGGTITINGGAVTATGSNGGAGIGGGYGGSGGVIIVNSGVVTATGGGTFTVGTNSTSNGGAGIGGGNGGSGGVITINGGTITHAKGSYGSAGIGGGNNQTGGVITVNGGTIDRASGGGYGGIGTAGGAGIGGGNGGEGGDIIINGGTISIAVGGEYGAGIGGGNGRAGGVITINGGTIGYAQGGTNGAGIGGGQYGKSGIITINGGNTINARGSSNGTAIGYGYAASNGASGITINGGTLNVESGSWVGQGIGGVFQSMYCPVVINGGSIIANGDFRPKNSEGEPVYLTTLTVDSAADGTPLIAAGYGNGSITTSYGVNDVVTRDNDKVYFYLPAANYPAGSIAVATSDTAKYDNSADINISASGGSGTLLDNSGGHTLYTIALNIQKDGGAWNNHNRQLAIPRLALRDKYTNTITARTLVSSETYDVYDGAANTGLGIAAGGSGTLNYITTDISDFGISNNNVTFDNTPKNVTVTPQNGAGTVAATYYTGTGGTAYNKSAAPPKDAGAYDVTVNSAEGAWSNETLYLAAADLRVGTLTVNPKTIDIAPIPGLTVPAYGGAPVTTIGAAQYAGTVSWSPNPAAFDYATVYTATITLTPKANYTLTGVAENFFTAMGTDTTMPNNGTTNRADSGIVTAVFPATANPPLNGSPTITLDAATGALTASTGGLSGGSGAFAYVWSGNGVTNSGAATLTQSAYTLGGTVTLEVSRTGAAGSKTAAIAVYKTEIAKSGGVGADDAVIDEPYGREGDTIAVDYTVDTGGTAANKVTFSYTDTPPVDKTGNGTYDYRMSAADAANGVITIGAAFSHTNNPTAVNVSPRGIAAQISGKITVAFDKAMNSGAGTVSLTGGSNNITNHSWSNGNTVYEAAYDGLAYSTEYTIVLTGFEDASGNALEHSPGAHKFTTEAVPYMPGVSTHTLSITEGRTETFNIDLGPGGSAATGADVLSDNTGVAAVSPANVASGAAITVTGVSPGSTTIRVTFNGGPYDAKTETITVVVVPAVYSVAVQNDGNGTADASLASAQAGTLITLTNAPNSGYQFKEWQVVSGGVTINGDTFTMPGANVIVKAIFEPIPPAIYTVAVQNDGNGTASASPASARAGTLITLTSAPNNGYRFKEWQVVSGGVTISGDSFTMPGANVIVKAIFEPIPPAIYTVAVQNDGNGTADASLASAQAGTLITLTSTPNSGYRFKEWQVISGGATISSDSFTMPGANVLIKGIFEPIQQVVIYSVTVQSDGGGTASASPVSAQTGALITLTNTPDSGYKFKEWQAVSGGVSISGNTFTMPASDVTIRAIFEYFNNGGAPTGGGSTGGGSGNNTPTSGGSANGSSGDVDPTNGGSGGNDPTNGGSGNSTPTSGGLESGGSGNGDPANGGSTSGSSGNGDQTNGGPTSGSSGGSNLGSGSPTNSISGDSTPAKVGSGKGTVPSAMAPVSADQEKKTTQPNGINGDPTDINGKPIGIDGGLSGISGGSSGINGGSLLPSRSLPFTDVYESDWFYHDVVYVYTHGLFSGTTSTLFSPNENLTRGMIVTVLHRLAGKPDISGGAAFDDIDANAYYAKAVAWAKANNIVRGIGGDLFAPDLPITRQDLAVILQRYAGAAGLKLPETRDYPGFNDAADVADYAKGAIEVFFKAGIVNGKPGNVFDTKGTATRAETAAMLRRFIEGSDQQ